MTRTEYLAVLVDLARELIPTISNDFRASEESEEPGMQVTIGADGDDWTYQTGDNSFTGGAYGYRCWGVGELTRDTKPEEFAEAILSDLEEQTEEPAYFFFEKTADET